MVELDFVCLFVNGEVILEVCLLLFDMGGIGVVLLLGGFMQVICIVEMELLWFVLEGVGKVKKVVDFFVGVGIFVLCLVCVLNVYVLEGDVVVVVVFDWVLCKLQGLKKVMFEKCDLF